jgi:Obg family GTPase CgtA-like protein
LKRGRYSYLFFADVSASKTLEQADRQYRKLSDNYDKLQEEIIDLRNIKQKAQSQAIRIALINKVSNTIRESMDISKILQSALFELANMFGSFKAYYASNDHGKFRVEEIYGEKNPQVGELISFDTKTFQTINDKKISVIHCLKEYVEAKGYEIMPVSAATGEGLQDLMWKAWEMARQYVAEPEEEIGVIDEGDPDSFEIIRGAEDADFEVKGKNIERLVAMTNFDNEEALYRFQLIWKRLKIEEALLEAGIQEGQTVRILDMVFNYQKSKWADKK